MRAATLKCQGTCYLAFTMKQANNKILYVDSFILLKNKKTQKERMTDPQPTLFSLFTINQISVYYISQYAPILLYLLQILQAYQVHTVPSIPKSHLFPVLSGQNME